MANDMQTPNSGGHSAHGWCWCPIVHCSGGLRCLGECELSEPGDASVDAPTEPMADLTITIRARVPLFALGHMFEAAKNNTPRDGILMFEYDGTGE